MSDLDTLLTQSLALVSEDKRGELADVVTGQKGAPPRKQRGP